MTNSPNKEKKLNKLLTNPLEVRDWMEKYAGENDNYTINPDGTVDVRGSVAIHHEGLTSIDVQFNVVESNFDCSDSGLISLRGCPKIVKGFFSCRYNLLTDLMGGPMEVGRGYDCSHNLLKTLVGIGKAKGFNIRNNRLVSLKGVQSEIEEEFNVEHNYLTSLIDGPKYVGHSYWCAHNLLASLEGLPEAVEYGFYCHENVGLQKINPGLGVNIKTNQREIIDLDEVKIILEKLRLESGLDKIEQRNNGVAALGRI